MPAAGGTGLRIADSSAVLLQNASVRAQHHGVEIDALLSGLPTQDAGGGMMMNGPEMGASAMFDAPYFDLSAFMEANMVAHDAVTSTALA